MRDLATVTAERDAALARLADVAAIHYEVRGQFVRGSWCHGCPADWPCATYRAAFPDGPPDSPVSPKGHNAKTPAAR